MRSLLAVKEEKQRQPPQLPAPPQPASKLLRTLSYITKMKLFAACTVVAVSLVASHGQDTTTTAVLLRGFLHSDDRHLQSSSFSVTSLQLVNTSTNAVIVATIVAGATINVPAGTPLSINAVTTGGPVGSVQFGYGNNTKFKVESFAPYALCGDTNASIYTRCAQLIGGTHTVSATPFSAILATGTAGTTVTRTFTIVMEGSAPVVPVPVPVPLPSSPVTAPSSPTAAGPSPTLSSWLAPVATPVIAVAAAHLPDGRLLMW
jgi:hypothetical protein